MQVVSSIILVAKKQWKQAANTSKCRLQALLFWLQKGEFARHEPQMAKALCGPPDEQTFLKKFESKTVHQTNKKHFKLYYDNIFMY